MFLEDFLVELREHIFWLGVVATPDFFGSRLASTLILPALQLPCHPLRAIASFVRGHNLSAGCSWGECEGRQYKCIPLGIFTLSLKCHRAPSTTKTTLFSAPTSQCRAKSFKTRSKSWLLTNGSIHQYVSPVLGCTKPYNHNH